MDALNETVCTFDKFAEQYQDKYMKYEPYVQTWERLSRMLAADAKILDVACGPGNVSHHLINAKPDRKVHGIDLSAKMVSLARINNPGATFEIMDSRDIYKFDSTFDGIVAGFCIPYLTIEEVKKFIFDAREIIKNGGIFYLSTMEGEYDSSGLQTRNNIDWVCTYYYTTEFLISTLAQAGFEVIDVERKSFEREGEPEAVDIFIYATAGVKPAESATPSLASRSMS